MGVGAEASLLSQQLNGRLASVDFLRASVRVHLDAIPSTDEVLCDLGMFAFVTSHLLSAVSRHSSVVADILCLVERLEDTHTKVYWIISSPHLSTTLIYDVLRRWSQ